MNSSMSTRLRCLPFKLQRELDSSILFYSNSKSLYILFCLLSAHFPLYLDEVLDTLLPISTILFPSTCNCLPFPLHMHTYTLLLSFFLYPYIYNLPNSVFHTGFSTLPLSTSFYSSLCSILHPYFFSSFMFQPHLQTLPNVTGISQKLGQLNMAIFRALVFCLFCFVVVG